MTDRVSLLLKVFKVELEDTEKNVLGMVEYYSKRFELDEITPYVWMENKALLLKEINCVKELEKDLAEWVPDEDKPAKEVLEDLLAFLKKLVKGRGYPELVTLVIDRIGDKILRYVE